MSLDVSPDGRTIVFELLGNLYTLPITGGTARQITSGLAFNRQPRYSPDGRHLVFISDRSGSANVWISDQGGDQGRQLSDLHGYAFGAVTSPTWSPDGRTIVVSQMLGATRSGILAPSQALRWLLAGYDIKTGRMRWISDTTADRARAALGPAFGPDGDVVYAAMDAFRREIWSDAEHWRIARVEVATGRIWPEIGSRTGRGGMRPAVSPNGHYLIYASSSGSHTGFRIRDLRTDSERWLVREVLDAPALLPSYDSRDLLPGYAFTPDSRTLIAGYGGKLHGIDIATGRVSPIPFVVEVDRRLGPLTVQQFAMPDTAVRTRSVAQPALSPDGQLVAFSTLDRIWVMKLPHDGRPAGLPYRVTADSVGEFFPAWSPDGKWIAYTTWQDGAGGVIRRVRVMPDRKKIPAPSEQLTSDTAHYSYSAVSPDGKRIVAIRVGLRAERALTGKDWLAPVLTWIPTGGGVPQVITSLAADHSQQPILSSNSIEQVYFTDDPSRIHVGLTSWRLDGTDREAALVVTGSEDSWQPYRTSGILSPDRRRALLTRKYTLFELSIPVAATRRPDTLHLERARSLAINDTVGAARRWATALAPWSSWSHDGRRVIFSQGGTIFVGDIKPGAWTSFERVDVPLVVPVHIPRGTLVLRGARLITMRGHQVIERGDIVVRDNRIAGIGATGTLVIPPGARVLDVSGATILPGYVDVHDHLRLPTGVHPQQCWQCLTRLAYGVTAARDPQPEFSVDIFSYRERERTGELLGPRLFSTGIAYLGTDPPIRSLDDAREAVRPHAEYFGSETFKVYNDPATGRCAWQLLAMALAEQRLNATAHTNAVELALKVAVDGFSGIEHAPHERLYDDAITLIARSRTTHTQTYGGQILGAWNYMLRRYGSIWGPEKMRRFAPPTIRASTCAWCAAYVGAPERDELIPSIGGAGRIAAEGGRIAMGSHGDIPGLGFHYEMWLHAVGGMAEHDILRSATITGATAIGHANDFGSLESGKLADLQVLDRNPLEEIHNTTSIRHVMKNGRLYKAEDLTEIWPQHKPLAPIYLWHDSSTASPSRSGRPAN